MISMTPEQAAFLLQYQLPSVKNEYRTTSAIIAAIPTSNADYRPDPQPAVPPKSPGTSSLPSTASTTPS